MVKKNYILFVISFAFLFAFVFFIGDYVVSAIDVSACGTSLNSAGATYDLINNISSTGTCLSASAENITLDCHGYKVTYGTNGNQYDYGIQSEYNNITIKNCSVVDGYRTWVGSGSWRPAIVVSGNSSTIFKNFVNSSDFYSGIYLSGRNSNTTNNTAMGHSGIYLENCVNHTLVNNNASSSTFRGIVLSGGSGNTLISNNISGSVSASEPGLHLEGGANHSTFINNTISGYLGLFFWEKNINNTFINNNITGSNVGVQISSASSDNTFRDCFSLSGGSLDINLPGSGNVNNTFINCSYTLSKESVESGSTLIRKWYYKAYVNNTGGSAVSDANVTAYNTTSQIQFTAQTNSTGWIQRQEVTEYNNSGGTRSFYNNYTINANKSGYTNASKTYNFTITQNKVNDFFTLGGGDSTAPTITFETPPTPVNASSNSTSPVTIVANISDASNTSSWIDFNRTLVGYWAMDYYNSTAIFDNSTYKKNGTFNGGLGTGDLITGVRGLGLKFDGNDDYLNIGTYTYLPEYSFSLWIKRHTYSGWDTIIGSVGSGYEFDLDTSGNGTLNVYSAGQLRSTGGLALNEWSHVVIVNNATGNFMYINGVYNNSNANTASISGMALGLGIWSSDQYLNSSLDEVMIFNKSLSLTEIKALYDSKNNKFNTSSMNLSNGQNNYTVYAIDEYGNAANSGWRNFSINTDLTAPTITFESPTPSNTSSTPSPVTVVANISDASNTTSFIDFDRTLILWLSMEGNAFDNSSYNWSTTNGGAVFGTGKFGLAATNFTSSAHIDVNSALDYASTNMTISFWMYVRNGVSPDRQNPITKAYGGDGTFTVEPGGTISFFYGSFGGDGGSYTSDSSPSYTNATWEHWAIVRDRTGRTTTWYKNGVADAPESYSSTYDPLHSTNDLQIGYGYTGNSINGSIDEVMIFNRTLNAAEIKALYDSKSNKFNTSNMTLANGQHNYTVYAKDTVGNTASSGWRYFVVTGGSGLTDCGTLSSAGTTYYLNNNVSNAGTCFTVTAANVTIDCQNSNWINYSTGGATNTYGVYTNQFNTTVKNCNIVDGNWTPQAANYTRHGISVLGGNNSILFNNFVNVSSGYAINITNSMFSNLTNNRVMSNKNDAIDVVVFSNNSIIINNTARSIYWAGIRVDDSSNATLMGNTVLTGPLGNWGLMVMDSPRSNLTNNYARCEYNCYSLYVTGSSNSTLVNNTAIGISEATGFYLTVSNNLTVTNNNGSGNGTAGFECGWLNNSLFINNTATNTRNYALSLWYGLNNTIINQTAISTGIGGAPSYIYGYGISVWASNNTMVRECVNTSGWNRDIGVVDYNNQVSLNNTFLNCSYNTENVTSVNGLIRKWYYQAYVNYSNSTLVYDANVTAYNVSNNIQFTQNTNASGWIQRQEVIDYINSNGTKTFYSNYIINASKAGYKSDINIWNFTIQTNKINDFFTLSTDVNAPVITFEEPPTPINASSNSTNPVTIVANISDASNTSAWIDLDRSLVGYWAMDYYNSTGIYDNSTYKNNGTFQGGLSTSSIANGVRGNALNFDGGNDYINISDSASLRPTDAITISIWVKPNDGKTNLVDKYGINWSDSAEWTSPGTMSWVGSENALKIEGYSNTLLTDYIDIDTTNGYYLEYDMKHVVLGATMTSYSGTHSYACQGCGYLPGHPGSYDYFTDVGNSFTNNTWTHRKNNAISGGPRTGESDDTGNYVAWHTGTRYATVMFLFNYNGAGQTTYLTNLSFYENETGVSKRDAYELVFSNSTFSGKINNSRIKYTLNSGQWNHLVMTYNRSLPMNQQKLYLNGVLVNQSNLSVVINTSSSALTFYLNGSLDEVLIFNRSLSETEVLALYNSKNNKFNTSNMTLANGQHNYTVYAIDEVGNTANSGFRNFTLFGGCTYSSGNWNINCSQYCNITSNVDVLGNNVSISGVGTVTVSANVSNYMNLHINGENSVNICRVRCINGGCFKN